MLVNNSLPSYINVTRIIMASKNPKTNVLEFLNIACKLTLNYYPNPLIPKPQRRTSRIPVSSPHIPGVLGHPLFESPSRREVRKLSLLQALRGPQEHRHGKKSGGLTQYACPRNPTVATNLALCKTPLISSLAMTVWWWGEPPVHLPKEGIEPPKGPIRAPCWLGRCLLC